MLNQLTEQGWTQVFDVLNVAELLTLNSFIDQHKAEFIRAKVGKDHQESSEIRGDSTLWIDPLNPPEEFRELTGKLEALKLDANRELFLGLKEFECHLAVYPPGAFYKKHVDRFEKDSSRSLTFIYYLHQTWAPGDGGELILYDKHDQIIKEIQPVPGSMVAFISEDFPHEVMMSFKERRSFTGWMHTKRLY